MIHQRKMNSSENGFNYILKIKLFNLGTGDLPQQDDFEWLRIIIPEQATCQNPTGRESMNLDYIGITEEFGPLLDQVQVDEPVTTYPHRLVKVALRVDDESGKDYEVQGGC